MEYFFCLIYMFLGVFFVCKIKEDYVEVDIFWMENKFLFYNFICVYIYYLIYKILLYEIFVVF